jgi:CheY-like chemotaxis protein
MKPAHAEILLVEDDPSSRKLIRTVLRAQGYDVVEAEDLDSAQQALARSLPRLVLLDLRLHQHNGLELVRAIRADPRLAPLPVVVVTAQAMQDDEERALRAGVDGYVSKPIDTRRFARLVDEIIRNGRRTAHAG